MTKTTCAAALRRYGAVLVASGLFAAAVASAAPGDDAGMVTALSGGASYRSGAAGGLPVRAYMKLREGDHLTLSDATGRVQLIYFATGRQEIWTGPAQWRIGSGESAREAGSAPVTRQVPLAVLKRLEIAPGVTSHIANRTGMHTVRSLHPHARYPLAGRPFRDDPRLHALRDDVDKLRALLPADDPTADLAWLAGLFHIGAYDDLRSALPSIRQRHPGDAGLAALADSYEQMAAENTVKTGK